MARIGVGATGTAATVSEAGAGSGYGTSSGPIAVTRLASTVISPPPRRESTSVSPSWRCALTDIVRPVANVTRSADAGAAVASIQPKAHAVATAARRIVGG